MVHLCVMKDKHASLERETRQPLWTHIWPLFCYIYVISHKRWWNRIPQVCKHRKQHITYVCILSGCTDINNKLTSVAILDVLICVQNAQK